MAPRLSEVFVAMDDSPRFGVTIRAAVLSLYAACDRVAENGGADDLQVVGNVMEACLEDLATRAEEAGDGEAQQLLVELHELVSKGTAPDDPFQELLSGVVEQASQVYGSCWRDVSLSLLHRCAHPRGASSHEDPYALTATTSVNDRARVELHIYPDEFELEAYAAIPMILVHECVCHVPARQYEIRNASLFAEGFLDWAAIFFFDRWVAEIDAALAPAARHHGERLCAIRKRRRQVAWAERVRGQLAAEKLANWFQTELGRPWHEAQAKVALLAVELNKVRGRLQRKDCFVSQLPLLSSRPELRRLLREWELDPKRVPAATLLDLPLADEAS
jgi:hypothetical protein